MGSAVELDAAALVELPLPPPLASSLFLDPDFDPSTFLLERRHTPLDELRSEVSTALYSCCASFKLSRRVLSAQGVDNNIKTDALRRATAPSIPRNPPHFPRRRHQRGVRIIHRIIARIATSGRLEFTRDHTQTRPQHPKRSLTRQGNSRGDARGNGERFTSQKVREGGKSCSSTIARGRGGG